MVYSYLGRFGISVGLCYVELPDVAGNGCCMGNGLRFIGAGPGAGPGGVFADFLLRSSAAGPHGAWPDH